MKKDKKVFLAIYVIIIILIVICFFISLITYNQQPLIKPIISDTKTAIKEHFYEIAKTYCENKIDDFEEYDCIENKYVEGINSYILLFKKENALLFMALTPQGEVTAFTTLNQNELDQYKTMEIDNIKIKEFIENNLKEKYGNNFKKFVEKGRKLKILEGKFVLECSVETELKNGKPFFKDELLLYLLGE